MHLENASYLMFVKGNIPKWNICVRIVCFNVIFISWSNVIFQLLRVHIVTLCLWYWFFFHSDMGWWRLHKRHSRSRLWYCTGSGLGAGSVGLCAESFNRWVLCVSSSQNLGWEKSNLLPRVLSLLPSKPERTLGTRLRKQPIFGNASTGFPAKWRLRNEHKNYILMTCHYPDPGSAPDWSYREREFSSS